MPDSTDATPTILMLPGLGADERLFLPQLEAFPNAAVPAWIDPEGSESLRSYAERFSRSLGRTDPTVLVGFSFGGMVWLEVLLARLERGEAVPPRLMIINGCRAADALTILFKFQARIASAMPEPLARVAARHGASIMAKDSGLDGRWTGELRAMASRMDLAFLRWASRAAAAWTLTRDELARIEERIEIRQVRGARDRIIPDPHGDSDTTIENGPHLLTWTHAERINDLLRAGAPGGAPGA